MFFRSLKILYKNNKNNEQKSTFDNLVDAYSIYVCIFRLYFLTIKNKLIKFKIHSNRRNLKFSTILKVKDNNY